MCLLNIEFSFVRYNSLEGYIHWNEPQTEAYHLVVSYLRENKSIELWITRIYYTNPIRWRRSKLICGGRINRIVCSPQERYVVCWGAFKTVTHFHKLFKCKITDLLSHPISFTIYSANIPLHILRLRSQWIKENN